MHDAINYAVDKGVPVVVATQGLSVLRQGARSLTERDVAYP